VLVASYSYCNLRDRSLYSVKRQPGGVGQGGMEEWVSIPASLLYSALNLTLPTVPSRSCVGADTATSWRRRPPRALVGRVCVCVCVCVLQRVFLHALCTSAALNPSLFDINQPSISGTLTCTPIEISEVIVFTFGLKNTILCIVIEKGKSPTPMNYACFLSAYFPSTTLVHRVLGL